MMDLRTLMLARYYLMACLVPHQHMLDLVVELAMTLL